MKKGLLFILIILLFFTASCSRMNYHIPKGPVNALALKDGTFIGEAKWTPVYVKLEVTIKDNTIVAINIIKHRHGPRKRFEAGDIIPKIIQTQSTQVEAVTGATYSSRVIAGAVQDALNKAKKEKGL